MPNGVNPEVPDKRETVTPEVEGAELDPDVPEKRETVTPEVEGTELDPDVPQELEAEVQENEGADAKKKQDGEAPEDEATKEVGQKVPKKEAVALNNGSAESNYVVLDVPEKEEAEPPDKQDEEQDDELHPVGQIVPKGQEAEPLGRE